MKFVLSALSLLLIASSAHALKMERLKVAVYDFPPHVFVDPQSAEPTGATIEFLTEILDLNSHYQIQWVISPFSRFLADMEGGRADIGLLLAKTPERERLMRYAERPIFTTDSAVILPKDTVFVDLKSLRGKTLGHTLDSVEPNYFQGTDIKFDCLSGDDVIERNLRRLSMGRIDGVYIPTYSNGEYLLRQLKMTEKFKIVKIPNTSLDLYFVFRKNIGKKIYAEINSLLKKKHSAYSTLVEKYLNTADNSSGHPRP